MDVLYLSGGEEEYLMSFLGQLGTMFNYQMALILLIRVFAALLSLSVHEACHGFAAWKRGDVTARQMGRLSMNPLRHIDPLGFLLLVVAGFGWAKPVPIDPRHFKNPKQGMALTALAGPVSNFILAALSATLLSLLYHSSVYTSESGFCAMAAFAVLMWLNIGLGIFNLFPIPPLDGSKVLFSFLPDRAYAFLLHYERYVMLLLFALVFFGVLDAPLGFLVNAFARGLCNLTGLPVSVLATLLNFIYV